MLQYFDHFSIYHWFILAVGIGMTTVGYFVKPDQPMTLKTVAEVISESSLVDPEQPIKIKPIAEIVTEPSSNNPSCTNSP